MFDCSDEVFFVGFFVICYGKDYFDVVVGGEVE